MLHASTLPQNWEILPDSRHILLLSAAATEVVFLNANLLPDRTACTGLEHGQLTYVAVHGTGTPLGDPIEVGALGAALAGPGGQPHRTMLGSVKSCYGHTEGCAGLTGALLAMQALRFQVASPALDLRQIAACEWLMCMH